MASTLQAAMKTSILAASPSFSSQTLGTTSFGSLCSAAATNNGAIPSRSPRRKNSICAATSRRKWPKRPVNFPFSDMYSPPEMAAAEPDGYDSSWEREREREWESEEDSERFPPDIGSELLENRIVSIGLPLVSPVTEMVIAQLMYLQWDDPDAAIMIKLNSTGTMTDNYEAVALETEGFAIHDTVKQMKCEVDMYCCGVAGGQACLLLASGTKGRRFIAPLGTVSIEQPCFPPFGYLPATDVDFQAKEASIQRDAFINLMAKYTGNSVETVFKAVMEHPNMDAVEAKEFGIVDKVWWRGHLDLMRDQPRAHWDPEAPEEEELETEIAS